MLVMSLSAYYEVLTLIRWDSHLSGNVHESRRTLLAHCCFSEPHNNVDGPLMCSPFPPVTTVGH